MKKYLVVCFLLVAALSVGCTSKENVIASEGLQRGLTALDTNIADLAKQSRFYISEYYYKKIEEAASKNDKVQLECMTEEMVNAIARIDWIVLQAQKAREYTRFGQRYIWEQQGILTLILEDINKAKARVLPPEDVATTQPS